MDCAWIVEIHSNEFCWSWNSAIKRFRQRFLALNNPNNFHRFLNRCKLFSSSWQWCRNFHVEHSRTSACQIPCGYRFIIWQSHVENWFNFLAFDSLWLHSVRISLCHSLWWNELSHLVFCNSVQIFFPVIALKDFTNQYGMS